MYYMVFNKLMKMANSTSAMKSRRGKFRKSYPRANKLMNYGGKLFGLQRQVRFIKGMINAEKLYADININTTATLTGVMTLINSIAAGDDVSNRTGNSILHKYLKFEGRVNINGSATATNVRIIIFADSANQGATPATLDVLATASPYALKNIDNQKRFIILRDKYVNLCITGDQTYAWSEYIKTNFHCRYSATGATNVLQNALYILFISNEAANEPQVNINIRNAYYDN